MSGRVNEHGQVHIGQFSGERNVRLGTKTSAQEVIDGRRVVVSAVAQQRLATSSLRAELASRTREIPSRVAAPGSAPAASST